MVGTRAEHVVTIRRLAGEVADVFTLAAEFAYEHGLDPERDDEFAVAGRYVRQVAREEQIALPEEC